MSISINRNMPPKHRQPQATGGGIQYVQRTVEVTIDTLDGMAGTTGSIPIYGTRGFYFSIPLTNLAHEISFLDFDYHDYYDVQSNNIRAMPFDITSVNIGMTEQSGSLINYGIHHKLGYLPQIDDLVLWVKLFELNVSSTIYTPQVSDLRNPSFDIQVIHEARLTGAGQGYTPVLHVNWSDIKYNSST